MLPCNNALENARGPLTYSMPKNGHSFVAINLADVLDSNNKKWMSVGCENN